jgi:hypothetical protein
MKKLFILAVSTFVLAVTALAQDLPSVDKSPMDIAYYPTSYPQLKIRGKATDPLAARVIYSRPQKNGRTVFGSLVEYGKVWRLGANEATEIEFYKPVTIGGKKVPAGRYTLYALVNEKTWTFIINKETDIWGAFKYDESKDVARVDAAVEVTTDSVESLSMTFAKSGNDLSLVVAWDNVKAKMPISL